MDKQEKFVIELFRKHYNFNCYNRGFFIDWIDEGYKKSNLLTIIKYLVEQKIVEERSIIFNGRRIKSYTLTK